MHQALGLEGEHPPQSLEVCGLQGQGKISHGRRKRSKYRENHRQRCKGFPWKKSMLPGGSSPRKPLRWSASTSSQQKRNAASKGTLCASCSEATDFATCDGDREGSEWHTGANIHQQERQRESAPRTTQQFARFRKERAPPSFVRRPCDAHITAHGSTQREEEGDFQKEKSTRPTHGEIPQRKATQKEGPSHPP